MALDADLVVDRLADQFVVKLGNEFAPQRAFSLEVMPGSPGRVTEAGGRGKIQVEVSKDASAVQTDSVDYQTNVGRRTLRHGSGPQCPGAFGHYLGEGYYSSPSVHLYQYRGGRYGSELHGRKPGSPLGIGECRN